MANTIGIHVHKVFKLGKTAAKKDHRNLEIATLLHAAAPSLPSSRKT